jgi:hypothetical protein
MAPAPVVFAIALACLVIPDAAPAVDRPEVPSGTLLPHLACLPTGVCGSP